MEKKTIAVYDGIDYGDYVACNDCGTHMLLPPGADQCPECTGDHLEWADENAQEMSAEELIIAGMVLKHSERILAPQDYLTPDVLQQEFPEYYRWLTS